MQIKGHKKLLLQTHLYTLDHKLNIPKLKKQLENQALIEQSVLRQLISKCKSIFKSQPNMIKVNDPVLILGDIHGQYYDLLKILNMNLIPEKYHGTVIFLGDYVDRGVNSMEVIILLIAMKINNPQRIIMLRGNHQCRILTSMYNFRKQCYEKYGGFVYQDLMDLFDCLPLVCVINNAYFCVHGGITDKIAKIEQINSASINRFRQIPLKNAICDFMWADPTLDQNGRLETQPVCYNYARECSIYFGKKLSKTFLEANNMKTIIRAHQMFQPGYRIYNWDKKRLDPEVITVFSAPNYCGTFGNLATFLKIQTNCLKDQKPIQIKKIKQQLTDSNKIKSKINVFEWSLRYLDNVLNKFNEYFLNSIVRLFIPQFQKLSFKERIRLILIYKSVLQQHKKIDNKLVIQSTILGTHLHQALMKAQEESKDQNYMSRRSTQYFGTQSYPKVGLLPQ